MIVRHSSSELAFHTAWPTTHCQSPGNNQARNSSDRTVSTELSMSGNRFSRTQLIGPVRPVGGGASGIASVAT